MTNITQEPPATAPETAIAAAPPTPPRTSRLTLYALLFLCQFGFLGYILYIFASPPEHVKMFLEEKPTLSPTEVILPLAKTLDSVNLFSGSEFLGLAPDANLYRKSLAWDEGQFIWILLKEKITDRDPIMTIAGKGPAEGNKSLKESLQDGVLNFIYDLGGREDLFKNNWGAVGVKELQISAMMPWTKRIDFLVISSFNPDHLAGLSFIARLHPNIPIFSPPLPFPVHPTWKMKLTEEQVAQAKLLERFTNLTALKPGCAKLCDRVRVLVSPVDRDLWGVDWELSLLIKRKNGWCLVAGSGYTRPLALMRMAKNALSEPITLYVGGTGMMIGSDDSGLLKELRQLKKEAPDLVIVPNYNTSSTAHDCIREVFGTQYRPGHLGEHINL